MGKKILDYHFKKCDKTCLKKNWLYFEKKTFNYHESCVEKRRQFIEELSKIDPENVVYSDEAGIDDNEVPIKGWAPCGKRCYAQKNAERTARYNIVAALNLNQLIAPFIFEGYLNTSVYLTYLQYVLIPALRPGMVLVIDNASFHKSKKITLLVEAAGCKVIFLPPYSPDLNPIEHYWNTVKTAIRKAAECLNDFYKGAIFAIEQICKA